MSGEPNQESRANRFQADLPAGLELGGTDVECRASNVSRSGTLVHGFFPAVDVTETWVTLRSPTGDLQFKAACRIVRIDGAEGEARKLALEFLEVRDEDLPTLEGLIARAIEGVSSAALAGIPEKASQQEIRAALEAIPIPHRIQLAMRGQPREREILIHDSSMQVIDALAHNPGLLPHEAMTIVRLRNIMPSTVRHIAKDPRWAGNQQLRVQVVSHRGLPVPVAQQLMQSMPVPMLRRVIQAPDLNPVLRDWILSRIPGGRR
jgi:hypothetical protein